MSNFVPHFNEEIELTPLLRYSRSWASHLFKPATVVLVSRKAVNWVVIGYTASVRPPVVGREAVGHLCDRPGMTESVIARDLWNEATEVARSRGNGITKVAKA